MAKHPRQPCVLVVDDDADVASVVSEILRDAGYAVTTANDGATALKIAATQDPAVVLVDWRMPVMDGQTFVRRYRDQGGQARILALTAGRQLGSGPEVPSVDAVLLKPFELDALLGALAGLTGDMT